jgi:hypothetical protein
MSAMQAIEAESAKIFIARSNSMVVYFPSAVLATLENRGPSGKRRSNKTQSDQSFEHWQLLTTRGELEKESFIKIN